MAKRKRTNNNLLNITHKTQDRVTDHVLGQAHQHGRVKKKHNLLDIKIDMPSKCTCSSVF